MHGGRERAAGSVFLVQGRGARHAGSPQGCVSVTGLVSEFLSLFLGGGPTRRRHGDGVTGSEQGRWRVVGIGGWDIPTASGK